MAWNESPKADSPIILIAEETDNFGSYGYYHIRGTFVLLDAKNIGPDVRTFTTSRELTPDELAHFDVTVQA